jgi:hypothetical protein
VALRIGDHSDGRTVFRRVGVVIESTHLNLLINKDLNESCPIGIKLEPKNFDRSIEFG